MSWSVWIAAAGGATFVALVLRTAPAGRRGIRGGAGLVVALAAVLLVRPPGEPRGVRRPFLVMPGVSTSSVYAAGVPSDGHAAALVDPSPDLRRLLPFGTVVPDVATAGRRFPEAERFVLVGRGLEPWERLALGKPVVRRSPGPPPLPGIADVTWSRNVAFGTALEVWGVVTMPADGEETVLTLRGPGAPDPVALVGEPGAVVPFRLRAVPRRPGRHRWSLALEADGRRIDGGTVDAFVEAPEPVSVLWIEDAPSFESRHVREWLADGGGRIVVRSRTSLRDHTTVAADVVPPSRRSLDEETLASVDLVIADGGALTELSRREVGSLSRAVEKTGLGLLTRPEGNLPSVGGLLDGFRLVDVEGLEEILLSPSDAAGASRGRRGGGTPAEAGPSPLSIPARRIEEAPGLTPLLVDSGGRMLVARRSSGAGWVAVSLVTDSFRWVLEGHPEPHRRLWSEIVTATARPRRVESRWHLPLGPISVDEPVPVILETGLASPRASIECGDAVAGPLSLGREPARPTRWGAVLRPRGTGWCRLTAGEVTADFAAGDPAEWTAWRQTRRERARATWGPSEADVSAPSADRTNPLPATWLRTLAFACLVGGLGALWLDERRLR